MTINIREPHHADALPWRLKNTANSKNNKRHKNIELVKSSFFRVPIVWLSAVMERGALDLLIVAQKSATKCTQLYQWFCRLKKDCGWRQTESRIITPFAEILVINKSFLSSNFFFVLRHVYCTIKIVLWCSRHFHATRCGKGICTKILSFCLFTRKNKKTSQELLRRQQQTVIVQTHNDCCYMKR